MQVEAKPLFPDVSVKFGGGNRHGLIGANACGKSLSSVSDVEFEASLTELRQLAKTLGFEVVGRLTQKRAGFDAAAYFGTGKREELRLLRVKDAVDVILVANPSRIRIEQSWA